MAFVTPNFVVTVALLVAPFLPGPHDKDGLGLRVHLLSAPGPYFTSEPISRIRFDILLLNHSNATIEHDPLVVAGTIGDLDVSITQPNGKLLPRLGRPARRDPFTQQMRLRSSEYASDAFRFADFGYDSVHDPGRYRLTCTLKVAGKLITAPPLEFEVIEVPATSVLISHTLPLEGREAIRPAEEQTQGFIQQVKVGERILLLYRRNYGPKLGSRTDRIFRLAELPGKCEMTVQGAYGAGKPLTITYKTSPTAEPTKLVINSISGTPWVEPPPKPPEDNSIPAPRPVKP